MKYLVCEHRQARHDKAVIHIEGKCWPQRDPDVVTPNTDIHWFGYYKTLGDALDHSLKSGRMHITKCGNCFRGGEK